MAISGNISKQGDVVNFTYSGGIQTFTVPVDGYYKFEVWGAQGGDRVINGLGTAAGGRGGYSIGYKELKPGNTLFICVGQKGLEGWYREDFPPHSYPEDDPDIDQYRAYNGGGYGWIAPGGGATHIALDTNRGVLKNYINNKSEILLVAGGGGGGTWGTGRYSDDPEDGRGYDVVLKGGDGGGLIGDTADWHTDASGNKIGYGPGAGGTQTGAGKPINRVNGSDGAFGTGALHTPARAGGGGGGWYGGNSGEEDGSGGGGSGYIGGVPKIIIHNEIYSPSTTNGINSGNGRAVITFVKNKVPTMYLGAKKVLSLYKGNIEITDMYLGTKKIN